MSWTISQEYHKGASYFKNGKEHDGAEFFYAIRRADGSLLYRAGTLTFAEEIIGRLVDTHKEAAA